MKTFIILLTLLNIILFELKSQEIVMDLGGPAHSGFYNTKAVRAFNKVLWATKLEGYMQQNFICNGDTIFVAANLYNETKKSITGYLYAINVNNGTVIWKDSVDQNLSSPTMKDNILYCGSDSKFGKQYAFNCKTGKQIWSFNTKGYCCYPPVIFGNSNYFGSHGNQWYEIDNRTGNLLNLTENDTDICCSPSVYENVIYYVDWGKLHAYDPTTKKDKWIFKFGGKAFSAPAIVDGVIYFVNERGEIFALDLNGNLLWSNKTDDTTFRSPSVHDSIATLITTNGHIYAFNIKDGSVIWDLVKKGKNNWPIYTHTAIVEDIVYVGCADGFIYAFDLKTGKELWKFETGLPVGTPVVVNGTVLFTSGSYVFAIN